MFEMVGSTAESADERYDHLLDHQMGIDWGHGWSDLEKEAARRVT